MTSRIWYLAQNNDLYAFVMEMEMVVEQAGVGTVLHAFVEVEMVVEVVGVAASPSGLRSAQGTS